jgi:hypothetical protein
LIYCSGLFSEHARNGNSDGRHDRKKLAALDQRIRSDPDNQGQYSKERAGMNATGKRAI